LQKVLSNILIATSLPASFEGRSLREIQTVKVRLAFGSAVW
jgi:hypothetical protein